MFFKFFVIDKIEVLMGSLLLSILSILVLTACTSPQERPADQKQTCSLLKGIDHFDFVSLFSPYEQFNCDQVFNSVVKHLESIGNVRLSAKPPSFTTLLEKKMTAPASLMLSLGKTDDYEMRGSLKMATSIELLVNGCQTYGTVWENKAEVNLTPDIEDRTQEMLELVDKIFQDFKTEYLNANPKMHKPPVFEVLNVDLRL